MESPYTNLQWRFRSEHYFSFEDHKVDTTFCSIIHYDITIGNDVARDVHCDIIMGHDLVMEAYHDVTMHADVARNLIYYVLLSLIVIFLFS